MSFKQLSKVPELLTEKLPKKTGEEYYTNKTGASGLLFSPPVVFFSTSSFNASFDWELSARGFLLLLIDLMIALLSRLSFDMSVNH